jgi:steroid delta-isomerase-like uncharacterized protein
MNAQDMINKSRRLIEEGYGKGNVSLCKELCDSRVKFHDPTIPKESRGIDACMKLMGQYIEAFPAQKVTINHIFASNNFVTVLWNVKGKHEREFLGLEPTHRTFDLSGISVFQFSGEKITETWQAWDRLSLFEQLGVSESVHAHH